MENIIMHIDVNNAFLSWHALYLLENGSKVDIRNTYAVIGGDEEKRTGIVLAKSFPCKKLGIKTADTIYSARLKCKNLKVYPPNFKYYAFKSNALFNLLSKYTPDIEVASIDECYLDYGKVKNLYGDEVLFAHKIKEEIKETLGFTVNIGIGNNKLCAKMASDFLKPDRVHTLYLNEVKTKMWPLDVSLLFGVGKRSVVKLNELGIKTIYDLAHFDVNILKKYFKNQAPIMIANANGYDSSLVDNKVNAPKGIGNEFTLSYDTSNIEIIFDNLLMLSELVGSRLRKEKKYAYTVVVTIKTNDFIRKSHQKRLKTPTDTNEEIYNVAKEIYKSYFMDFKIRLIGIRLDNLVNERSNQLSFFEDNSNKDKDSKLDYTIDNLRKKYGNTIIKRASMNNKKEGKYF